MLEITTLATSDQDSKQAGAMRTKGVPAKDAKANMGGRAIARPHNLHNW
jgi:hypothetical protein